MHFPFLPQCDHYYYYVILISWCEKRETTTQQCLRKYFGNFCWDILVDTSKISPLISLKSTFGKVFFLFLHFTFTSISISILNCVWFFVWTKQYYILGHYFGIFGTYWHLHQHKRLSQSGVNEFPLDYMATGSSMWGQLLVGFNS